MRLSIAATALAALLAGGSAQAAITVVSGSFIGAPTAFNGFENLPANFGVPYVEQGIAVRYVTDEDYNIFSTIQAYEGTHSFFAEGVTGGTAHLAHGYTDNTLSGGGDFPSIQFAVGSAFDDAGARLNYQLLNDGVVVQTGVAGPVPAYGGFNVYGFYGAPFDEVRLQVNFDGVFDPTAIEAGDLDAVSVGAVVPEPGGWALLIVGFGLTGAALRGRRVAAPVRLPIRAR